MNTYFEQSNYYHFHPARNRIPRPEGSFSLIAFALYQLRFEELSRGRPQMERLQWQDIQVRCHLEPDRLILAAGPPKAGGDATVVREGDEVGRLDYWPWLLAPWQAIGRRLAPRQAI